MTPKNVDNSRLLHSTQIGPSQMLNGNQLLKEKWDLDQLEESLPSLDSRSDQLYFTREWVQHKMLDAL